VVPGSVPSEQEGVVIPRIEPPHLVAVCRGCGRISALSLTSEEVGALAGFASRAPDGWAVDGISLTLTATCRRCREGPDS
jgi:Fe2+ or Zn2+ uptake regulation protein